MSSELPRRSTSLPRTVSLLRLPVFCLFLLASFTVPAFAQVIKTVEWGQEEVHISIQDLYQSGFRSMSNVATIPPSFGGLVPDGAGGLLYTPDERFWQVGVDAFQLELNRQFRDVYLIANLREDEFAKDACSLGESWSLIGDLSKFQWLAQSLTGDCAFQVQLGGAMIGVRTRPQALTGPGGGNTSITLDPGIGGFPDPYLSENLNIPLAAGVLQSGQVVFELVLNSNAEVVTRAYRSDGSYVESEPIPLVVGDQEYEMDWWFASAEGAADGGVLLSRNGVLEAEVNGVDNFGLLDQLWDWSFGLLGNSEGASGGMVLRDPEVWVSPRQPVFEPIFADSASTQTLERWSQLVNETSISITGDDGQKDPEFNLHFDGSRRQVVLQDESPMGERHYRARYSLDLSQMLAGQIGWTNFSAFATERTAPVFRVQLRFDHALGAYQVRGVALSGGGQVVSAWSPLPPGVAAFDLALQWWAAGDTHGGGLRLWVDDAPVVDLRGLANAGSEIEAISLGAMGLPLDWKGDLKLDDIFTWR